MTLPFRHGLPGQHATPSRHAATWHIAATLAAPALRLLLRHRAARGKEVPHRLPEREGIDATPRPPGRLLWLHAASVGESLSMLPVLSALPRDVAVVFTTGTATSAALLAERLPALGLHQVLHRFVPLDVPAWAARFLDHWQPNAAAFVETELWPNLLAALQARRIPAMLVNARMSARSARGWARAPGFARHVLTMFNQVQAGSEEDAARLRALGAQAITAPGNLKASAPPLPADDAELARLQRLLAGRPVWLAASTHPGEEAVAGQVHRRLAAAHPGLLTIVAPRHPERGAPVAEELATAGLQAPRRSLAQDPPESGIWIADTLGELGLLYRLAPVVFVGRSLVGQGGQNPLEPARLGCAVAVGPHTANFIDAVQRLTEAGGLTQVADTDSLAAWVDTMLRDPDQRAQAAAAATAAATANPGLPEQTAQALLDLMGPAP